MIKDEIYEKSISNLILQAKKEAKEVYQVMDHFEFETHNDLFSFRTILFSLQGRLSPDELLSIIASLHSQIGIFDKYHTLPVENSGAILKSKPSEEFIKKVEIREKEIEVVFLSHLSICDPYPNIAYNRYKFPITLKRQEPFKLKKKGF